MPKFRVEFQHYESQRFRSFFNSSKKAKGSWTVEDKLNYLMMSMKQQKDIGKMDDEKEDSSEDSEEDKDRMDD